MIKAIRLIGSLVGSLIIGAVVGLILYFVVDLFGLIDTAYREIPLPDFGRRLPFGGFVAVGAILGILFNLLGKITE